MVSSALPLHTFKHDISDIPLPEKFTYPFHYTPHPLCLLAAKEVQEYLGSKKEWEVELQQGKMLAYRSNCVVFSLY